jgi:aminoglycoside phosphotransferase (APT) family kinase protein
VDLSNIDQQSKLITYISNFVRSRVTLSGLKKLSGGAIQENWALDVHVEIGDWAGDHEWVLRQDAVSKVEASVGRAEEYQLLKVAKASGVEVPVAINLCEDKAILGQPFFLMSRLKGTAAAHVLTKGGEKLKLVRSLAQNLARIHSIDPIQQELSFLGEAPRNPALHSVTQYRSYLDAINAKQPAIEFGLAWLQENAPEPNRVTLCHRDYRTGNFMVNGGDLTGILDWEFSGWSDPMEDIGWICAKCWRFREKDKEVGGLGSRQVFYKAYEQVSGHSINPQEIKYWEVMAHVRWATIACQQSARHYLGEELSLELALTGYIVPELEYEILKMAGES